ncbi:MAG: CBS domain-containing protein [Deltaproteobacteria bacterium]|nr:CBS domain-containing protein [Deltaproteobacteria bacterium]MBW2019077.1 CBS domain-containing protein [Deltaproteobacteria bacterium]MBW2073532.1 CBS domain-containing protein [Deltaproteobacteria bacterium]
METKKKVKDLVIPLSEYPHMPYWATLREAIAQLNVAFETGHHTVLVFDEAYKLVGMLLQKDILKGLEPKFAEHHEEGVPIFWNGLLKSGSEKRLSRPIKEFMSEVTATIDAEDSILKASHIMLQKDAYLLPVMEGDKLIGVVRMGDLFHKITNAVLKL